MNALPSLLLTPSFLGHPVLVWGGFLALVFALLAFDLRVVNHEDHVAGFRESLVMTGFYIAIALLFGAGIVHFMGREAGMLYLTAYLIEKSLSLDNVFVISLLFSTFSIPRKFQHRVLFWGILGALVMRGGMIAVGAAMVSRFHWVLYLFGAFLVFTGIRMLVLRDGDAGDSGHHRIATWIRHVLPMTDDIRGHDFFIRSSIHKGRRGGWVATPLFAALAVIEIADVVFAVDSIPAVLALTDDAFIVFTSNIFAILGLRALYMVLAVLVERFTYLRFGLAGVLVFIGAKVFWSELVAPVPAALSLGVTAVLLGGTAMVSFIRSRFLHRP